MYLRRDGAVAPRPTTRFRIALARRPWIRWLLIAGLAIATAAAVSVPLGRAESARASWTDMVTVFVVRRDHAPGDALAIEPLELPRIAVPVAAVTEPPREATARQRITAGEIVVAADVAEGEGPAARAAVGTVVVPLRDALVVTAPLGARVAVYADGVVLTASAVIVDLDGDVIFIAVAEADGPIVAAATQAQTASLAFLP